MMLPALPDGAYIGLMAAGAFDAFRPAKLFQGRPAFVLIPVRFNQLYEIHLRLPMPEKKTKKEIPEMTNEELAKHLFPKPLRDELKKAANEPKKKPAKPPISNH